MLAIFAAATAALPALSGTAAQAPDPVAPGGMAGWAIGLVVLVLMPYAFKKAKDWAKSAPHEFLAKAKMRWQQKLDHGEVDAEADELVKAVGVAVARYAEKKIPAAGMGQQRMDMIVRLAKSVPYVGWIVARYEKDFREFFEIFVKAMDDELKEQTDGAKP